MANNSVNFDLQLAIKGFQQSLDQAKSSIGGFTSSTTKQLKEAENSTDKLSASFSGNLSGALNIAEKSIGAFGVAMFAANLAASAFQTSIGFIQNTIAGSLDAYAGSEAALNKLAQSMKLTNSYSEEAAKGVEAFATELEASSVFSDDAIIGQVAFARSLGLSTAEAENFVTAAANLSATLGGSLEENVDKLGKTLSGSAGRLAAYIPELKNLTDAQLKAGAAADIINKKYAGAAANDLKTYSGQVAVLKNQYDNLQEAIGGNIINSTIFQGVMNSVSKAIVASNDYILNNTTKIENMSTAIAITAGVVGTVAAAYGIWTVAMSVYAAGLVTTTAMTAAYTGAASAATVTTWSFNAAIAANPIGAIVTAVVAAVALLGYGIYKVIQYWDELKIAADKTLIFMLQGLLKVQSALTGAFGDHFAIKKTQGAIDDLSGSIDKLNAKISARPENFVGPKIDKKELASRTDKLAADLTEEKKANAAMLVERKNMLAQKANLTLQGEASITEIENAAAIERLNFEIANSDAALEVKQAQYQAALEARIAQEAEELTNRQNLQVAELDSILNHELAKAAIITDALEKKKAQQDAYNKDAIARQTLLNKQQVDTVSLGLKSQKSLDEKSAKDKQDSIALKTRMEESYLTSAQGFISAASAIAKQGSREAKALAITDATIATYLGATKAFASVPYPANFVAAASVIAGGLANIAKITSAGSFATGGFIGGSSFSGDKLTANVNSGEAVLNASQQKEFMKIANGGGSSGSLIDAINILGDRIMNMEIKLYADDNEIAKSTSRGVQNGILIGSSR